ncbi:Pyranose dehydrogenase [Grifola frondosa]|uniref:Pyranose dehydrogenase n=1 Tax=Grifola frondosa TaxID=5627 RepID=A0A1C7LUM2_GRIFR|nr:Pyranose dehydrogenase [Grifola frondosa]
MSEYFNSPRLFQDRFCRESTKEVILSAGSIGTPQILQLSGIGDAALLRAVNVEPLVNLTDVGKNLIDHPLLANHWFVNSTSTMDAIGRNATLAEQLFQEWNTTELANSATAAWISHLDETTIGHISAPRRSFSGPTSAHIEIIPMVYWLHFCFGELNGVCRMASSILCNGAVYRILPQPGNRCCSPVSRGAVTLASNDPFDSPIIDPGLLADPFDQSTMVAAIKTVRKLLTAPVWDGYVLEPYGDLANATTDAALAAYAQKYTSSIWHPVGTARMAAKGSDEGVVDASLKVLKTEGLRIVDASVFPFIPAAHTQAAVYAFAERAADMIKAAWAD